MKILRVVAVAMLLIPAVSFAQGSKKELNPWVDCGLGAMIFDETTWAAVISNIIWDLGTTAVISDSLSQQTCNSKKAKTAAYIGTTYANLSEEMAKGDGQHLRAMLDVRGCSADSHQSILSSLRGDFAQSLRDVSYSAKPSVTKAEDFYNLLEGKISTDYRQACSA